MKALLYTSDPYEPSGTIGLFKTKEQKQEIIKGYLKYEKRNYTAILKTLNKKTEEEKQLLMDKHLNWVLNDLHEIEIPLGIFGCYF